MAQTLLETLSTAVEVFPEMDEAQFVAEFQTMVQRNWATQVFLDGRIPLDTFEDTLAESGLDPILFQQEAILRITGIDGNPL